MDLRIGYFPLLDAALALRQAHDFVRFQPFNGPMQAMAGRLDAGDRARLDEIGTATRGWLGVIEALLDPPGLGLLGLEEGLPRLEHGTGFGVEAAAPLLAHTLRAELAPEAGRRARPLLAASDASARGIRAEGLWDYVLGLSDRVVRTPGGELRFRITPELRVCPEELERVILTPSLFASRRLTFWKHGSTLLLYGSVAGPGPVDDPPESLLISALAVADRTRLRMLRRLAQGACSNLQMAEFLGVNPSTASRHFKLFKDAGFVQLLAGEDGRSGYALAPAALTAALATIADYVKGGE